MITEINESKILTNIHFAYVNLNLTVKDVTRIKRGIMINTDMRAKI